MKKSLKIGAFLLFTLAMCLHAESDTTVSSALPTTSDILLDIERVKVERDIDTRVPLTDHMLDDLYTVWDRSAMSTIGDEVITELASLLDDDDDWIRASAAAGIGYFGPRARRLAPALERALERAESENRKSSLLFSSGVDSAAAIGPALKRIQGIPDSEIFGDPPKPDGMQ